MLSAITASTGACGTCDEAKRRGGKRQAVRDREGGDRLDQQRGSRTISVNPSTKSR